MQDSQDDAPKLLAMARSPHTAHTLPLRICWLTTCPRRVLRSPSTTEADESDDLTAEVDDEAETDEDEVETDEGEVETDEDEAKTDEADEEAETDEDDDGEEEEASVAEAAETGPWSCAVDPATSSLFPVSMAESIVEEGPVRVCSEPDENKAKAVRRRLAFREKGMQEEGAGGVTEEVKTG